MDTALGSLTAARALVVTKEAEIVEEMGKEEEARVEGVLDTLQTELNALKLSSKTAEEGLLKLLSPSTPAPSSPLVSLQAGPNPANIAGSSSEQISVIALDNDLQAKQESQECEVEDHTNASITQRATTARTFSLKDFRHGENFTTWCARFKRDVTLGSIRHPKLHMLLMNKVDDKTLAYLEPVSLTLTKEEQADPELFIPRFEQAVYPASEAQALRLELSCLTQDLDEPVEDFGTRLLQIASRAYRGPENSVGMDQACLNTFLNGVRGRQLRMDLMKSEVGTFQQALRYAIKLERISLVVDNEASQINMVRREDKYRSNNSYRRTEDQSTDFSPSSRPGQYKETRSCYNCNEVGHLQNRCPRPRRRSRGRYNRHDSSAVTENANQAGQGSPTSRGPQ